MIVCGRLHAFRDVVESCSCGGKLGLSAHFAGLFGHEALIVERDDALGSRTSGYVHLLVVHDDQIGGIRFFFCNIILVHQIPPMSIPDGIVVVVPGMGSLGTRLLPLVLICFGGCTLLFLVIVGRMLEPCLHVTRQHNVKRRGLQVTGRCIPFINGGNTCVSRLCELDLVHLKLNALQL